MGMFRWWKRVKKKVHKVPVLKTAWKVHKIVTRKTMRVTAYAAPLVGGALFGTVGAAAGTAVSQGALKFTGWHGKHLRQIRKNTLILGGGSIAAAGAYSLIAGKGLAVGPLGHALWGKSAVDVAAAAAPGVSSPVQTAMGTASTGLLSKVTGAGVGTPKAAVTDPGAVAAGSGTDFTTGLLNTAIAGALAGGAGAPGGGIVKDAAEGILGPLGGGGGGMQEAGAAGGLDSGMIVMVLLAIGAFMLFSK